MDLYPKFIIQGDALIMSKVTYHNQLVEGSEPIKGGGWFKKKDDAFIFYGDSHDYGAAKFEDIKRCVESNEVYSNKLRVRTMNGYKFGYDTGTEIIMFE